MGDKVQIAKSNVVSLNFQTPLKKLTKARKILSEDDFSQGISKIIERDFFPDIPKLQDQTEYFEALDKNDLVKLREIQMKFRNRLDTGVSNVSGTPATFETPEGRRKTTPAGKRPPDAEQPLLDGDTHLDVEDDPVDETVSDNDASKVSLDSFLSQNTSEDSASFAEILNEAERKHRVKHAWLFEKEQEQLQEHYDMMVVPSIEQQAAITDRSAHINSWKYTNTNAVMYVPAGVDLSAKELIELQKHKPKEIVHSNTRFRHCPFSNSKSKEAMQKAASFRALINQGKIGHDGKEIQASQSPQVNGYGFVGTPSPAPGVSESPLMTWGEIDSTPTRLDNASDLFLSSTPGPVFKIPAVPKRDRLALELSERASKAHRAKKEEAIRQVTRRFASPSPTSKICLSSSERLSSMSPAAQRLASQGLGVQTSSDKALQASYSPSPSPSHRLSATATPVRPTPGSRRSRGSLPGSPALSTPDSVGASGTPTSQHSSLTDHLLNLPKRKRTGAADFF